MSYNPALFICALFVLMLGLFLYRLHNSEAQLIVASRQNDTNAIARLVTEGTDVNASFGASGKTPLMTAAAQGNGEAVKVLLQLGARADFRDASGKSALEIAAKARHTNVVLLIRAAIQGENGVNP